MKPSLILLICASLLNIGSSRAEVLPSPTGNHLVGVAYRSFTDENRKEIFDRNREANREITVKIWYPSDRQAEREPYLLAAEAEFATTYLLFPSTFKDFQTNASRDVPVSSKESRYPVLIFSHGWGEHYAQNTILMEELASNGYIVFSVSHHYECKFSSYPDGRLIHIEMGNPRFQEMVKEQMNPDAMALFGKLEDASSDEERVQVFLEMSAMLPMILTESPKYWAEDIAFLIDRLIMMNDGDGLFKDKLDVDRIGVFGMSLGGLATSVVCSTDMRVKAGVSIDGGLSAASIDRKCHVPFMFLNSKRYLECGALFVSQSNKDCYSLSVEGSDHYNFTDYSIYPVPSIRFLLGQIDGKKTVEMMNVIVLAFFEKYLKEKQEIDIVHEAKKYEEIAFATNIQSH